MWLTDWMHRLVFISLYIIVENWQFQQFLSNLWFLFANLIIIGTLVLWLTRNILMESAGIYSWISMDLSENYNVVLNSGARSSLLSGYYAIVSERKQLYAQTLCCLIAQKCFWFSLHDVLPGEHELKAYKQKRNSDEHFIAFDGDEMNGQRSRGNTFHLSILLCMKYYDMAKTEALKELWADIKRFGNFATTKGDKLVQAISLLSFFFGRWWLLLPSLAIFFLWKNVRFNNMIRFFF